MEGASNNPVTTQSVTAAKGEDGDSAALKSIISTVTSGTIITMLGTIGFLALSLAWRLLIVRLITVQQWGELSLVFAFVTIISSLAPLGVQASITRNLAYEESSEWRGIVYSGLLVTAISGIAFTVAFYLSAGELARLFKDPQLVVVVEILSPAIFLSMIIGTVSATFQGFKNVVPYALFVNVLPNVFSISLALLLYYLGFGFMGILFSAVFNSFLVVLILIPYSHSRLKRYIRGGLRKNKIRMLIAFGLPLLIVQSLNSLMGYADTLLLGYFKTETIVGYYSAGLTLGRIVSFSISALSFIFLPVASQMYAMKRHQDLERTYSTATKWSLVTSVPFMAIFFLYPSQSLSLTFGGRFTDAQGVLAISAMAAFAGSLFGPAGATLVAYGRTRLLAINSALSVGTNIVACLVLIPPYGMIGGAYASAIGSVLFRILSISEVAFYYRLHPFNRFFMKPLIVSTVASFLILLPMSLHPTFIDLPLIFLGLAVLVVVSILVTKSVDKTDVLLLEVAEGIIGKRLHRLRRIGTMLVGKTK